MIELRGRVVCEVCEDSVPVCFPVYFGLGRALCSQEPLVVPEHEGWMAFPDGRHLCPEHARQRREKRAAES